jgi:tetratricopeptide (TPR) repeat protein
MSGRNRHALPGFSYVLPLLVAIASFLPLTARGQIPGVDELSEEEQRQVQIAERFLSVLEKNPRRGTALDRIYGHHVEFGTLDEFMKSLRDRVAADPDDGTGWMLLGMFASHRGEDADTIDAFRQAETLRPDDALASYYLGQSLLLLGQPEEAVAALERALQRNPPRTDLLEIFQQLGRVHQRAQRTEEALRVWERLEALFPDDPRVQEQIAVTLVEEGQYALALPRYERLAQLVRDDYRRTMYRIEAAELKIREKRRDEGLTDFERLLDDLNPAGWLYRDVRRRVEDVFLRSGDQDGLVAYYEQWLAAHPDDVDAMARLAKFLASSARVPEATQWLEKALQRAPSRIELRKAFIDQLVDDQRYAEASDQYRLLLESAPGNPDFLRDWGRLVLKDNQLDQESRRAEAARIWNRILAARPDDAPTTTQVADLFRQANMQDAALALYRKAVEQAPDDPQYREYLGEFYHILDRPDEALATWSAIAEGPRHTAVNVARLAEVYNSFGYLDAAVQQIADACQLDPADFALQLKAAEYHSRAGEFEKALAYIDAAANLADSQSARDAVITQRIDVFRSSRRLDDQIDALWSSLHGDAGASADRWHLLARYCEADSRWADATQAVDQALQKDPNSLASLATAARIAELSGDYARAAESNRQLASIDRRSRGDYLMNVARLEAQMGRADEALQAARDLIVSAPGNTDHYEFYAQLCFQLGKSQEGIETLRKAVRINPSEPYLIMALGAALAQEFRTDEAIEVYWRAFERTDDLDDKTSLVMKLTDLHVQIGQFDRLLERLERERRDQDRRREMTICLAQAHHTSGDYGTARQELESLLSEDTRDTNLLQQLSKLCQEAADVDGAIQYQRQLAAIAPGQETEYRLATLLQSRGDRDEASEILLRLMRREEDPARRLRNIDSMLTQGDYESVVSIIEPLLSQRRDDWELLYREAVAWASLEKFEEAQDRLERLLSLPVPHDELGVAAADRLKQAQAKARSSNLRGIPMQIPTRRSPLLMLSASSQIRRATGLDPERDYGGSRPTPPVWTPDAVGEARMAAYGWLMRLDQERGEDQQAQSDEHRALDQRLESLGAAAAEPEAGREALYDWMYVEQLRGNQDSISQVARQLARQGGRDEQQFFLGSLVSRGANAAAQQTVRSGDEQPKPDPLSDEDLELMLQCHTALGGDSQADGNAAVLGGQVVYDTSGQAYVQVVGGGWAPVYGMVRGGRFVGTIVRELRLAGREEQADQLIREQIDSAESSAQIASAMALLFQEEAYDRVDDCFTRWVEAARDDIARGPAAAGLAPRRSASNVTDPLAPAAHLLINWMGHLGPEEEHARILQILDQTLDISTEVARRRRAERSRRAMTSAVQRRYPTSYSLKYGKETVRAQFDYPQPNEHLDVTRLMLLREAYEVFQRNDVVYDLPAHLEARLRDAARDDRLYAMLTLACVRWWLDEKEDALVLFSQAADLLNDDPAFRLEIASLHQSMGDFEDALEIVEGVVPRDQKLVQQREMMALELAERLGDIQRARQSAERLFGLRLNDDTQLALVDRMRRLGMHEMAEAIISRVQRRSAGSLASLGTLMALYQGQGKVDMAQQLAHTILRRTRTPLSSARALGSPYATSSSQSGESQMRAQALRLLQQTGALKDLTERLEQQLERSPNAPRLYDELVEYYEVANEREKASSLLARAVEILPDVTGLRYRLAKHLESSGKMDEACDQYLEIFQRAPQLLAGDFYEIRRVFARANRSLDLVKVIEGMNLNRISQPYYVIDMVSDLLRSNRDGAKAEDLDLALKLFEKLFDAFPAYRYQLISRVYDGQLWQNERVFELGKRSILPSESEVAATPWFGLNEIYVYSGGQVYSQFHRMLEGVAASDKMAALTEAIEQRLAESPGWLGGEAMLALIELKQNRKDQARERLEKLVSSQETLKTIPADTCWMIGQELEQFEATRPLALKLFETALDNSNTMRQIQYSPVARLIKSYGDMGRRDDARNLLLGQIHRKDSGMGDPRYDSYTQIENATWAAQQLLTLEFPVDAVRIFRELTDDPARVEQAGQWYGNRPDYYKSQIDKGLEQALAALDSTNADQAMTQLLAVPEEPARGQTALDLMLTVPDIDHLRTQPMQSALVDLLIAISQDDVVGDGIRKRLDALRMAYPEDLSIAVTQSAFLMNRDEAQADETLRGLLSTVAARPLEHVPTGRRPNSRQRREALAQVPLWLVARQCLQTEDRREIGTALAERALEAARRQLGDRHTAAILYDWGKIALDRGDRQSAEAQWSELLDIVTRRPEQKKPATGPQGDSYKHRPSANADHAVALASFQRKPEAAAQPQPAAQTQPAAQRIPPLTVSQFRVTTEIALAAAENGMPALSQKAVRASLLGGIPVADVSGTSGAQSPFGAPSASSNPVVGLSEIETEVAESLQKVIAKWHGDAYPPEDVYQLLVPIVFPENRPAEILMYADFSKLQDAQITSLGELLVRWASEAKRLDDLTAHIADRVENPAANVAGLVLQTRVALAAGDLDAAKRALEELAGLVQQGVLPPMVQLVCHAALPATEHATLEQPAYAILRAAVNLQLQTATANPSSSDRNLTLGPLVTRVIRHLADEPEEVQKFFESYLVGRQTFYSRYSGTYGQYLQWRDWAAIAEEAAKADLPTVALDYMGRVADFSYENTARPSTATAMAVVCQCMSRLSAQQQYEVWRDWTLPTEGRQTIRLAAQWVEPVRVPASILSVAELRGELHTTDHLSNFTELLDNAQECGRMQELYGSVTAACDAKLENANFLLALILIRQGDLEHGRQVIEPIINTVGDRIKQDSSSSSREGWGDYLLFRACMQSPLFAPIYEDRLEALQVAMRSVYGRPLLARLPVDYALRANQSPRPAIQPGDDPQLIHWFPATTREPVPPGVSPWWAVQEDHLAHLTGAGTDVLYFAYPLTGEFAFTVDGYRNYWAETEIGYGGVVVEAHENKSRTEIESIAGHETVPHPGALNRDLPSYGTMTIKVFGGRMQYILNNQVVYEEELSGTSPWITLCTEYPRATVFRNPRFSGNPSIPREVTLVQGDRMDGWNTSFFAESQPRRRLMAQKPKDENDAVARSQRQEPAEFDWRAEDGLLLGRAKGDLATAQSWIYYHRPLRDRESFSYSFYYVPGQFVAHPTIGRIGLLLEPEGVVEHWIERPGWDDAVFGLSLDNRVTIQEARRGPERLPLKSADWNHVTLTLSGETIDVTLNGELVYQRTLEPEIDHRFGLYRGQTQGLKVREPKLAGPWPETLDANIRNDLLASTGSYTTADRRLINSILTEEPFSLEAGSVVHQTRQLPAEQAYQQLSAWVLPSADHPVPRLYLQFVADETADRQEVLCPAIELMAVAERAGKLDELAKAIDAIEPEGAIAERGKVVLNALIAMQAGQFDRALERMSELLQHVQERFDKKLRVRDRSIEYVVAWQAAKFPDLRFAAFDIATELRNKQRNDEFRAAQGAWEKWVDILAGHVERTLLGDSLTTSPDQTLTQWATVPYDKPQLRAAGYRHSDWLYVPGAVQHIPGGTWGQLFFQSPLEGNFEIVAERSLHGHREVTIAYGMHATEPRWDYKATRIATVMHNVRDIQGEVDLPRKGEWLADFRIVVNDDRVTTFVNGLQLHEETLSPKPAPWLVLQTASPGYAGTVRNLRILGDPRIPDEIDLINTGWAAWRADTYGEWFSKDGTDENAPWKKVGDEIRGELRENKAARNLESLRMYQRPMLEDGVIQFESYYVRGEFEVHPAVGRTALIVGRDGVKKHVLTDAQYETRGLSSDNVASIDGAAQQVDLKENDWNRYQLTLEGDKLTLTVNGTAVAAVVLTEPANQRHFGLFRYSDKTRCRVRNLVYRGQWPKTLPPVQDQQLARIPDADEMPGWSLPKTFSLNVSADELKAAGLKLDGPLRHMTATSRGMRFVLKDSKEYAKWPKLSFAGPIQEDFIATLEFEDLKMTPPQQGWGSHFVLRARFDKSPVVWVDSAIGMTPKGVQQLKCVQNLTTVAGTGGQDGRYTPQQIAAGRLRLVRTGAIMSTYFAEEESNEFRLLEMYWIGDKPVDELMVLCGGADNEATIDVVLNRFTIRTRSR